MQITKNKGWTTRGGQQGVDSKGWTARGGQQGGDSKGGTTTEKERTCHLDFTQAKQHQVPTSLAMCRLEEQ